VPRGPAEFDEADRQMAEALDNLVAASNYADWIVEMASPYLGPEILEVGAGHGTLTQRLAVHGKVTATDLSPRCVAALRHQYRHWDGVEVLHGDVDAFAGTRIFDSAVLVNVLEHIPDDHAALRSLWDTLRPGGTVVLFVPAFEALYGNFDSLVGHYRRYRRSRLASLVAAVGFDVVEARYVNSVGALAWWLMVRQLGRFPKSATSIRLYDRTVTPVVRRVEALRPPPFGQSVFCVGRRPC
jgi:SAM-dependent methyltransferase